MSDISEKRFWKLMAQPITHVSRGRKKKDPEGDSPQNEEEQSNEDPGDHSDGERHGRDLGPRR